MYRHSLLIGTAFAGAEAVGFAGMGRLQIRVAAGSKSLG
jgi:hypothetical protein